MNDKDKSPPGTYNRACEDLGEALHELKYLIFTPEHIKGLILVWIMLLLTVIFVTIAIILWN